MKNKKIISALLALALLPQQGFAATKYTVQKGDSFWVISQKFGITLKEVLEKNNANYTTPLYIGDVVSVPSSTYIVSKGDSFYLIAKKCGVSLNELLDANNANYSTILYIGDRVIIPSKDTIPDNEEKPSGNYITYETYTIKKNDTLWTIAIDCKIPMEELLNANNLTENDYVYEGMKLKYPVHHIAIKKTPSDKYGELLDWYTEAQYVVPINADFKVIDFETGKSFNARRTVGSGHADCEPLTATDTAAMKEIFGGTFSWNKRSVLIVCQDRKIAASMAGMLHAGNDGAPGGAWTSWRSDNWGEGTNFDYVKNNNAHGHFDLYFYNSIGHKSGVLNEGHQQNIKKSAGIN